MEGTAGMWPAGQLVVGSALRSQSTLKLAVEVCCALPSPSKTLPAPLGGFPRECIFKDHETGREIGTATSFPFPFLGEKP
jgi:hypothetical protein